MASTAFGAGKASDMNKTKKSEEQHNKNNEDDESHEEKKPKGSPIVAQPGVNTSSFLAVERGMV